MVGRSHWCLGTRQGQRSSWFTCPSRPQENAERRHLKAIIGNIGYASEELNDKGELQKKYAMLSGEATNQWPDPLPNDTAEIRRGYLWAKDRARGSIAHSLTKGYACSTHHWRLKFQSLTWSVCLKIFIMANCEHVPLMSGETFSWALPILCHTHWVRESPYSHIGHWLRPSIMLCRCID